MVTDDLKVEEDMENPGPVKAQPSIAFYNRVVSPTHNRIVMPPYKNDNYPITNKIMLL